MFRGLGFSELLTVDSRTPCVTLVNHHIRLAKEQIRFMLDLQLVPTVGLHWDGTDKDF